MNRHRLAITAVAIATLGASLACTTKAIHPAAPTSNGGSNAVASATTAAQATKPSNTPAGTASAIATNTKPLGTTADVVRALTPSVVRVRTEASSVGGFGSIQSAQGTGTGIVLDTQGHVLTNNHVVTLGSDQPAKKITVDLANGQSLAAQLVGREPNADLAVLKIDAKDLTPAHFADPQSIAVGEDVVAIGYALDLGSTPSVTRGVVSALGRQIDESLTTGPSNSRVFTAQNTHIAIGGAIQTDAAVNPGNSGGPLVDMAGNVIGLNTAGVFSTPSGEPVQGINYAVSVELIQPVAQSLIAKGRVDRGFLGILAQPITRNLASAQSLAVSDGVGIAQVNSGSPADQAGLKANDIIVKAGNHDIHTQGDLNSVLIENGPGTKLPVEYYRGSSRQSTTITLGSQPSST